MQVEIVFHGSLKRRLEGLGSPAAIELPDGCDIAGMFGVLRESSILPERRAFVAIVNGERASSDLVLQDGDQVHFYRIVSGG